MGERRIEENPHPAALPGDASRRRVASTLGVSSVSTLQGW